MDKVYVVIGTTGEYSDRNEWPVCAYLSEKDAQARVGELENLLRLHGANSDAPGLIYERRDQLKKIFESIDPDFEIDYTGTRYYYYPVPLIEDR